ncbi:MAG: beta-galactosidase [Deinococcus sp.]|nr:beta-galactosidase [Deinococcus sp.]
MFYFGADYYPEQWPESRWELDTRLMQAAHFNVVRLGEFAWSLLEPREGSFDFAWLDRAIALLHRHGISVVLGTPTATPPAWLITRYPEILPAREDGRRWTFGHRRHYCVSNSTYHQYTQRIVEALARHYCNHQAVIGWQIDNEFGTYCYCPTCQRAFQAWLNKRYSSLEALNQAWGTRFWSQVYTAWEQIPLPWSTSLVPNPSLALDYCRFMSEAFVKYQALQVGILRDLAPDQWITHNFMSFGYDRLNYHHLARDLDFASWDNYPLLGDADPSGLALGHSFIRGLHPRPFWVMEAQAGPCGWETLSRNPLPGQLRLWSHQALAHGAAGLLYFRWRTALAGTEQLWHGLLDHHGQPGRRYQEVAQTGSEFARLAAHLKGTLRAPIALILNYEDRFAFRIQPQTTGLSYDGVFRRLFAALHRHNLPCDVLGPDDSLAGLALVILPMAQILEPAQAARLEAYVREGGSLVVTFRSGIRTSDGQMVDQPLPGVLAGLCGLEVEEYEALPAARSIEWDGQCWQAEGWAELLRPEAAETVARYSGGPWAGQPAITRCQLGRGRVTYVGAFLEAGAWASLLNQEAAHRGVQAPLPAPGLEVRRTGDSGSVLYLLNHTAQPRPAPLPGSYQDLLHDTKVQGIELPPWGVAVLGE